MNRAGRVQTRASLPSVRFASSRPEPWTLDPEPRTLNPEPQNLTVALPYPRILTLHPYLSQSVLKVVLHETTPPKIRQLILYFYKHKEQVDGSVWELTLSERLQKVFV